MSISSRARSTRARRGPAKVVHFAAVMVLTAGTWSLAACSPADSARATENPARTAPVSSPEPGSAAGPAKAKTKAVVPGLRPGVQRWVMSRDRRLIRLNDALVPIVLGTTQPDSAECRHLDESIGALLSAGRAPHARVDKLATAGLDEIQQAARACLDGNFTRMRQLAKAGTDARAEASLDLEQTLEGE